MCLFLCEAECNLKGDAALRKALSNLCFALTPSGVSALGRVFVPNPKGPRGFHFTLMSKCHLFKTRHWALMHSAAQQC